MAEESEKRFEAIMKKIFRPPPKSRPNSNDASGQRVKQLSGRKRLHSSSFGRKLAGNELGESGSSLSGSSRSVQAPLCRPWDRGDLFKRLSTFKSVTWFAKPQALSPWECARRGWVNVDVDTIACASCDARLLFSTPSAWTQQQVEKAAMVFSLKLESGHKLLCPWMNNACAEELARFPIQLRASLIEDYKKRFFSLSQLVALPVIAPAVIDNLKASQLEQFLSESSTSGCHELLGKSGTELTGHVPDTSSSVLYYQVQKLISLFGWEPRILPYSVDFKDVQNDSVKDVNVIVTMGQKPKANVYSFCTSEGISPSELQLDPSSVVLDCKLCGASVGLWAFSTIPRPLEYIRFVGLTEVTGKNIATRDEVGPQEGSSGNQICTATREGITNTGTTASTSLGFTIAGGPPPAMLNYGANISLPVIGANLRARLPINTGIKDQRGLSQVEDQQVSPATENVTAEETFATLGPDCIPRNQSEVPESVTEGSKLTETVTTVNSAVADHSRVDAEEFSSSNPEDNTSIREGGVMEPDREQMAENREEVGKYPGIGAFANHKSVPFSMRENKKLLSSGKQMEFDPIKQHRHFCPWIMSTGKSAPGWQQTLSALEGHKELSNVHSSTLIKVDDPVDSVKKLFATPDEKRTKIHNGS